MDIMTIGIAVFISSVIGTLAGFGTSTVLIPMLTFFMPLPEIIFLVGIIHWFGSAWKIALFKKGLHWNIIVLISISGFISAIIGALLINYININILTTLFGIFLIAYMVFIYFQPHFQLIPSKINLLFGGALSGFFAGIFGMGGAIRGLLLNLLNLPKATYLATSGAIAIIIDSTRLTTYYLSGLTISSRLMYSLLLFIPLSLLGAFLAKLIVERLPQQVFRLLIAIFLAVVGMRFLIINHAM